MMVVDIPNKFRHQQLLTPAQEDKEQTNAYKTELQSSRPGEIL